jgi:hypothetical protein
VTNTRTDLAPGAADRCGLDGWCCTPRSGRSAALCPAPPLCLRPILPNSARAFVHVYVLSSMFTRGLPPR